jgi:hypothetical protein
MTPVEPALPRADTRRASNSASVAAPTGPRPGNDRPMPTGVASASGRSAPRWTDSPSALALVAGGVACVFVGLRVAIAAHGNVAAFIVVGVEDSQRAALPHGIPVFPLTGYDGEFYYRLALDPLAWGHQAFGIVLDQTYRLARIMYPALSWTLAGGQGAAVPYALVAVNVVAVGVATWLACALAKEAGRRAAWGLLLAGYWGFLWTLARDLTELVAAVGILGCLLALRRGRPVLAALILSVGVLARETVFLFVLGETYGKNSARNMPPERASWNWRSTTTPASWPTCPTSSAFPSGLPRHRSSCGSS